MFEREKLLFICSQNRVRSLTAEELLARHPRYDVRSAGTEAGARVRISEGLLGWADRIFVMEARHRERLRQRFAEVLVHKTVICLDIPDDYIRGEDALIEALQTALSGFIDFSK